MEGNRARRGAVLAGLLCIALLLALAWSFVHPWGVGAGAFSLGLSRGMLEAGHATPPLNRQAGPASVWSISVPTSRGTVMVGAGSWWRPTLGLSTIGASSGGSSVVYAVTVVFIPLWPWAVASGLMSAFWYRRARRSFVPGHCAGCGYDLREGTGDRCPECGRAILRPSDA